jgi:photosystem II stability/assembly factor-like uncharacterized protein
MRRLPCLPGTILLFLLTVPATPASAQETAQFPEGLLQGLTFRSIGPATMGGRIDDLAVLEARPTVFYVGAATGGVWKTVNHGTTWEPVFDHEEVASIGAVATPREEAELVWVGTGENNNRQSSSWGAGVYKSTDGGESWRNMGLVESRHIGRIVIDPLDHEVVYVAATGHLWGPNPERGVFKTTDGGDTWTRVLFVDDDTGATDLVMDPTDPSVLYAAMYQRRRSTWGFNGGGPGSGLYKSVDAGESWTELGEGIPAGPLGRIAVDVHRSDPSIVYALIQAEEGSGLYRSDDAGAHWTKTSDTNPRPSYFSKVRVDPQDPERVYVLGVRLMISDDGGGSFQEVRVPATRPGGGRPRDDLDVHTLWIDPSDPSHLVIGTDVGVAVSYDRGVAWDYVNNLPIGQFYHVGYDMDTPYRVYGGLQDNDVWGGPSASRNLFGIGNRDWFSLVIGDGFVTLADPRDSRVLYGETQSGRVTRIHRETGEGLSVRPQPRSGEAALRWAWDTPFLLSPHDANTLLIGAQMVFRSTDRGNSWESISPDLTGGADRDTLTLTGVKGQDITLAKNDGVSDWPTLISLTESPAKPGVYYAGSDDGLVHVSRDGGESWVDLTGRFPGLPPHAPAERLVASAFFDGTAYATFDNHGADDYSPYVYTTSDYGESWTSLASTLPAGQVVNCITEDPRNADVLYLGTESGLFVSLDRGLSWQPLTNNLPTVPIDEITIHPRDNDMLLATHGRSIWILDDLSPIQQAAGARNSGAYLFGIDPAAEIITRNDFAGYPGDRRFWGQNPEPGASVTYYLREEPTEIHLTIRDASGSIVREMSPDDLADSRAAGLNRVSWDLRHQPLEAPSGGGRPGGGRGRRSSPGPFVLPGEYTVVLAVDGEEVGARTVTVSADPLLEITEAGLRELRDTSLRLHRLQEAMSTAGMAIDTATAQVVAAQAVLEASTPPAGLTAIAEELSGQLTRLAAPLATSARPGFGASGAGGVTPEQTLRDRVGALKSELMSWTERPTPAQLQAAARAREELATLLADLNEILANTLPGLYATMTADGLNPPARTPIPPVEIR